jgi:hypothetical protein
MSLAGLPISTPCMLHIIPSQHYLKGNIYIYMCIYIYIYRKRERDKTAIQRKPGYHIALNITVLCFVCLEFFLFSYMNKKNNGMLWPSHSQINITRLLFHCCYMGVYPKKVLLSLWISLPTTCNSINFPSVFPHYLQAASFINSMSMVWLLPLNIVIKFLVLCHIWQVLC